jgi:hypothetical protein
LGKQREEQSTSGTPTPHEGWTIPGSMSVTINIYISQYKNIIVLPDDQTIRGSWAGVSLVWIELLLARYGYDSLGDWDYIINLAPSTLPLKPLAALEKFLVENNGVSFMQTYSVGNGANDPWPNAKTACQVQCESTTYRFTSDVCIHVRPCETVFEFIILSDILSSRPS